MLAARDVTLTLRKAAAVALLWLSAALAPAARGQSVVTAAPDPGHPILSAAFQAATDMRSNSRLTSGNALELLEDGVVAFPRRTSIVRGATSHLFVTTMQWSDDATGHAFADEVIAAARRGVEVRCVVDGAVASPEIVIKLRRGGVRVARYNPWVFGFGGRSGRMHEKIVCADFSRAIVGGLNIADEYALGNGSGSRYHDTDAYVEGYGAVEVGRRALDLYTQIDRSDWRGRALLSATSSLVQHPPARAPGRDGYCRAITNEPDIGRHDLTDYYVRVLREARAQVLWHVNNPQPRDPILAELAAAGARGVRVVILTNSRTAYQARNGKIFGFFQDLWLDLFDRPKLAAPGIEVWEADTPIHSKAMTVDGVVASIGSYNLGKSSIRHNTETNLVIYDPAVVRAVEEMFERDLAKARRVQ